MTHKMDVEMRPTGDCVNSDYESAWYLFCAYALLNAMPAQGLKEACGTLSEVYEYFNEPRPKRIAFARNKLLKASVRPIRKQQAFQVVSDE